MTQISTSPETDQSISKPVRVGAILIVLVFGVFGTWSAVAPLEGSAHAQGKVTVASYSKALQHLEGGIIAEILVADGDRVSAGQALIRLDTTQALADLEIVRSQHTALQVREARLISERDGLEAIAYAGGLSDADQKTRQEMAAQRQIFDTSRAARQASVEVLEQRIEQLRSKAAGLEALRESKQTLARSFADELEDTRALLDEGFSDKTRLRELERAYATYAGEAADMTAQISSTEVAIGETRLEIIRLQREFQSDVAAQLAEIQTSIEDVSQRVRAAQDVLTRTTIRSPVDGIVKGLQYHTIGGVISPATRIVDIVPENDDLIVEAHVSPNDIDRVALHQEAMIRFSAFSRNVPTIYGHVVHLSADSFVDEATGLTYYTARIEVTDEGMRDLGDLVLVPGMPAEAFISTGSRTFLEYLFKPLTDSVARSFIED